MKKFLQHINITELVVTEATVKVYSMETYQLTKLEVVYEDLSMHMCYFCCEGNDDNLMHSS